MKTLITQVGTYITGDAVADALMDYWLALMEEQRADVVDIPIVATDGRRSRARLTLGATLPIAVVDADLVHAFDDDGAADLLLARAQSLSPSAGPLFAPGELPHAPAGYDESIV